MSLAGLARRLWAPFAIVLILLHLAWGLACASLVFPLLLQPARNRLLRAWSRGLLRLLGLRLQVGGRLPDPEVLATGTSAGRVGRIVVANHVSWLDIYAIDAVVPTRFIAKADILQWPVIGRLVTLVGTLYVERGRRHAVHAINRAVVERLEAGETIGVYPEGTTTDGTMLLPFHANLLQPAVDVHAQVLPVAIRYTAYGRPTKAAAYIGEMTLVQSLLRVLATPGLAVEVHWLPQVVPHGSNRHALAHDASVAIASTLGMAPPEPPPSAVAAARARAGR